MYAIFVFIFGSLIGSFLAAYSYRAPLGISIQKGRSFCPNCHHTIAAYDNIPLISYLLLKAKCRNCHKKISPRYFLIELSTAFLFLISFLLLPSIKGTLIFLPDSYLLSLVSVFVLISIMVFIFVVDLEHQLILDKAVFFGIAFVSLLFLLTDTPLFPNLFAGFCASLFLLMIYLVTLGKGMGLGDVKFAILGGLILGPVLSVSWMLISFVLGAIVGLIMMMTKNAKLKSRIAFGPFLVAALLLIMFFGFDIIGL
jgi:leader peptidase (prepilin peptidase)/N-methyltransferase